MDNLKQKKYRWLIIFVVIMIVDAIWLWVGVLFQDTLLGAYMQISYMFLHLPMLSLIPYVNFCIVTPATALWSVYTSLLLTTTLIGLHLLWTKVRRCDVCD